VAVLLALVSAITYGVGDYCGGRATRTSSAVRVTLAAECTTFVAVAAVLLVTRDAPPGATDLLWGTLAGVAGVIGVLALYHALANAAMTVVAPVTAVVAVVIPVAVGLAEGERPGPWALVGVVVAVASIALVSGAIGVAHAPPPRRMIVVAIVSGIGFGALFVFLDRTSSDSGLWPVFAARWIAIPVLVVVALARADGRVLTPTTRSLAIAVGLLTTCANAAFLAATRRGLLSVVSVVVSLYPASTVLLATVIDGERLRRPQVVGLVLAGGALVLVTLGR
jgi:drug/metabolite transporter (DMT)-like permease